MIEKNNHICISGRNGGNNMTGMPITKEIEQQVINYYLSKPMTESEVANKFNLCKPTIGKILANNDIKIYKKNQLFSPDLIEDYFETINSEHKAYFLGLIISDGCIYSKNNKQNLVGITLQDKDKYILDIFKKEIKTNKSITSDNRGCSSIQILSNKMVSDLEVYGLCDNKSLKTIFPKNIDDKYYPHLIRGLLDGDGSVSFYARPNKKSHVKAIRFCQGNEQFLLDLVEYLKTHAEIKSVNLYKEKDSLWSIAYRNNESMYKLIHYLYGNATIYLSRKKELCIKIYNEINHYHGNAEITKTNKSVLVS